MVAPLPTRPHPRISAAKLGEYLTATPTRRRGIIRDQRQPQTFVVRRYDRARHALLDHLTRPDPDRERLRQAIERLLRRAPTTAGEADEHRDSLDALAAFLRLPDDFESRLAGAARPESRSSSLMLGGVKVSIGPDLEFTPPPRRGVRGVGALKLYFGKQHPLDERAAPAVAALLQRDLLKRHPAKVKVHPCDCLVVDVLAARVWEAPTRTTRLMQDLENACEEIAGLWNRP